MARLFNNRYPYTDFHELNIGWCIDKITDFEERLTDVEEDVADLKTRMTSVEGRMTTAEERIARQEQDIHGLSTTIGNIGTRVTTLENADIQDADMLEGVSSVEAGNAYVTVNFSAAAYADGVRTAGTDAAVIPAATSSAAGVMLPGEKAKLVPITVNGNDVTFAGKVAAGSPTAAGDLTTKDYVDSLAISGSATVDTAVSEGSVHFSEGNTQVDYDQFSVKTYGKVAQIRAWISHTLTANHLRGTAMFNVHIPSQYRGSLYENLIVWDKTAAAPIPCHLQGWSSDSPGSGTVGADIIPGINVTSGHEVEVYFGSVYLITV